MKSISGNIVTKKKIVSGQLTFDKYIEKIEEKPLKDIDFDKYILPGFIDLHIHGGGGFDVMDGYEAVLEVANAHLKYGTTSIMATTVTANKEKLNSVLKDISRCSKPNADRKNKSKILGCHLEGPFINGEKLGAQPNFIQAFNRSDFEKWNLDGCIKIVTLSSETLDCLDDITWLTKKGIQVQLGHSNCTYEQATKAIDSGASGFTHLYNAMSSLHHRSPGLVGAALVKGEYSEIIADLLHVHEGAIHLAFKSIKKAYCVSDATPGAGMPDGNYSLGSHTVFKCQNGVYLKDGTLAGSAITLLDSFKNLIKIGYKIEEASRRVSGFPAEYLGLKNMGLIEKGYCSDLVVLNGDFEVKEVYINGIVKTFS